MAEKYLEKEKTVAVKAAKEAQKTILKFFRKSFYVKKKGRIDLATQADFESEKKIHSVIQKSFPRDSFLEEESGKTAGSSGRVWIVDPIDGTINFSHGIPWFAVSIALMEKDEVVLGVVLNPLTGEVFSAKKGLGAFLNNKPIFVSKTKTLLESVVSTGFPYERGVLAEKTIQSLSNIVGQVQGPRVFGSAVLDYCLVARGDLDGFFEYKNFPWDAAAGMLLVQEAGGIVTDFDGKKATPFSGSFVASNSIIHNELLEQLVKP